MAEDEQIIKAPPEAVKKGGYCMIRGMPCKLEICEVLPKACLLYTSPSPRDVEESRMPSSA